MITITRLCREGCGGYLCILLWPHWVFGLIFPLMIGISTYGNLVGILLLVTSGVLPYIYWIIRINCRSNEHENYRTSPCCSCFCKDAHRRQLEKMIICKHIVAEGSRKSARDANSNGSRDPQDSDTVSFRTKHPKSDIVKKKRKTEQSEHRVSKKSSQIHDEESLFPISIPEEKDEDEEEQGLGLIHNKANINFDDNEDDDEDDNEKDDAESHLKSAGTSYSVQMCSICLEEYKVGDEIAWSRNDNCHHAFHKDCIIEWLVNHQNCPICRNKY